MSMLERLKIAAGGAAIAIATAGAANAATYENAADGIANAERGEGYWHIFEESNEKFGLTTSWADFLAANDATADSEIETVRQAVNIPGLAELIAATGAEATAEPATVSFAPSEPTIRPMPRPASLTLAAVATEPASLLPPAATPQTAVVATPDPVSPLEAARAAVDADAAAKVAAAQAAQDVDAARSAEADALAVLAAAEEALAAAEATLAAAQADEQAKEEALAAAAVAAEEALTNLGVAATPVADAEAALRAAQARNATNPALVSFDQLASLQSAIDAAKTLLLAAEAELEQKDQEHAAAVAAQAAAAEAIADANDLVTEAQTAVTNANTAHAAAVTNTVEKVAAAATAQAGALTAAEDAARLSMAAITDPSLDQCVVEAGADPITVAPPCEDSTVSEVAPALAAVQALNEAGNAARTAEIAEARAEAEALAEKVTQLEAADATADELASTQIAIVDENCDNDEVVARLKAREDALNAERAAEIAAEQAELDAALERVNALIAADEAEDLKDAELLEMACVDCVVDVPVVPPVETLIPTEPCGLERTLYNYAMIMGHKYDLLDVYNNNNIAERDLFPTNNMNLMLSGVLDVTGLVYEEVQTGEVKTECPAPVAPVVPVNPGTPTGPGTPEQPVVTPVPQACSISSFRDPLFRVLTHRFVQQPAGNYACCPTREESFVISENGVLTSLTATVHQAFSCPSTGGGSDPEPAVTPEPCGGCNGGDRDPPVGRDPVGGPGNPAP